MYVSEASLNYLGEVVEEESEEEGEEEKKEEAYQWQRLAVLRVLAQYVALSSYP